MVGVVHDYGLEDVVLAVSYEKGGGEVISQSVFKSERTEGLSLFIQCFLVVTVIVSQ